MTLQEKDYKKFVLFFSFSFIIIPLIELISIYILLNTGVNFYGHKMLFSELMFNSSYMPFSGKLLFILLTISGCFFLIIGITMLKINSKSLSENLLRAKKIFMIGILILIFTFLKLGYLSFLGRTLVSINGKESTFLHLIMSSTFGPFYVTVIWLFFTGVICFQLMAGLFLAALGLNWVLELQKQTNQK